MTTHNPKDPDMDTAAQIMADITANSPDLQQAEKAGRPRSDERKQFLTDVLTTAVEGGINYWATVTAYKWENMPLGEAYVDLYETEEDDPKAEGITAPIHHVTIDTIAHGIQVLTTGENAKKAFTMSGADYWKQFLLANRTNGEDGDYDADIADNILQAGIFGEIVYG